MKVLRMTVRALDKVTDTAVLIICLLFFLIGTYAMIDSYLVYMTAMDSSVLAFKPGYEADPLPQKKIKGHMAAWISIEGTQVDYPVMQGKDNVEYLNKDPFGDYNLAGSIFLDSRNDDGFDDYYSLIYGHHMEHGAMFGALDEYLAEGYLKEHEAGTLIVDRKEYPLRFFAVLEAEATTEEIFSPTEHDAEVLPYLKEHALFYNESAGPSDSEKLVALSTCKYPDTTERTIVFGVLEK